MNILKIVTSGFDTIKSLLQKLGEKLTGAKTVSEANLSLTDMTVVVGYTAAYALYVHENLQMKLKGLPRKSGIGVYWGPRGESKFLENASKALSGRMGQVIAMNMKAGKTMLDAMYIAGRILQRESDGRVPVEWGNLRATSFTKIMSSGERWAASAEGDLMNTVTI